MSLTDYNVPRPGDMIVAKKPMKAWVNDRERGYDGMTVEPGDSALVVQVWLEGRQLRLRLLVKDRLVMFSNALHCVGLNWSYGEGLAT